MAKKAAKKASSANLKEAASQSDGQKQAIVSNKSDKQTTSKPSAPYEAGPKSHHFEFGGTAGALGVIFSVPFFSYWLSLTCTEENGCPPWPPATLLAFHKRGIESMLGLHGYSASSWWSGFWSLEATGWYLAWYTWCILCWAILPGEIVQGSVMRNGLKKSYPMNAFKTLVASLVALAVITNIYGLGPLLYISNHWIQLVTATIAMSALQAFFVHWRSYRDDEMLALGGNTSSSIYNWFIGRSLNPSLGSLDIKSFNELRPGLILWLIIDIAMMAKQYAKIGRVTDSMCLVVGFQAWYVVDALWNESAILSTMDITTDGFGFMLAVGDLTWVPATYSYQAQYLSIFPNDCGILGTVGILAVQFVGYWIFRSSNGEKNDFRQGKNPKNLTFLETERGTKLLTSGWWGLSRHPNYFGDWLMAWAWCLPAGFSTPLPYFYVVFFAILLVHRQMRDDESCENKYGKDWIKYKKLVPYRIIPYVY